MTRGIVIVYFSRLGTPLRDHQRALLTEDAKAIARFKQYDFLGDADNLTKDHDGHVYLVPDDTLLADEARHLGIRDCSDFYGGVVPHRFVKTKSITHPLIDKEAARPDGWSSAFASRVRDVVLPGYTVFSARDARFAASRMLARGPIRVKQPLEAGGRGQTPVASADELNALLECLPAAEIAACGLVFEENLDYVSTLSVGHISVDNLVFTYHGRQRITRDNNEQPAYGGSDLTCVRGGWAALEHVPMNNETRVAVAQARLYDEAMIEYPGFMASRRNYDVGQGNDEKGQLRSGVLESSWRVGGATAAEVVAMTKFAEDPSIQVVEVSHLEKFGSNVQAPHGAVIHFQGNDSEIGPMSRYTVVRRIARSIAQAECGGIKV